MHPETQFVQPVPQFAGEHFTVLDLARAWKLSPDCIRELFAEEPGIIAIGNARSTRRRRYITIRIPAEVAERVYRRLQVSEASRLRVGGKRP